MPYIHAGSPGLATLPVECQCNWLYVISDWQNNIGNKIVKI